MGIYDDGLIFDHIQGETYYLHILICQFQAVLEIINKQYDLQKLSSTPPNLNIQKEQYEELVDKAKIYIKSGDIFQVVLSKRYGFQVEGDLINFYLSLRRINPSPYMYFLQMGGRRIIGSSPEMLVRVDGNLVETFPIAGT
ncbi:MAG: chorismate-binding protein, partial [Elusimicrobiales bacterium]|nr:chorismate-binding protein [Elusimicrobiales bacterium]